jgi:hypothetical protein
MGEFSKIAALQGIAKTGRITAQDVLMLRREVFGDGVVSRGEAESLFALDRDCKERCAEWTEFFVEALTDFIVHQETPRGYVSAEQADWLIGAIAENGVVESETELELLVKILEAAKSSPEKLSSYALEQVEHAVLDGSGSLGRRGNLVPGRISKAEVDLLRRILYAFGGDGNIAVTRGEAEALFRLNDRAADADNDPEWNELFVKALANFVLCGTGYEPPTRERALAHERFLDSAEPSIGGFFARMAAGGLSGMLGAYSPSRTIESDWEAHNQAADAQARSAEKVEANEARWLADRIGGDRILHDNEKALLAFIRQASPSIHPDLKPLLDKVA